MTTQTDDAPEAWTPAIVGMDDLNSNEDEDEDRTNTDTAETETDDKTADGDTDSGSGSSDTPRSEWTTASGETLGQREDHHSHPQSRNWSFGVIRVLRVVVGIIAFFVLLFNFDGAFERVLSNPGLAALTLAVIGQFIQVEDLQNVRSLLGR